MKKFGANVIDDLILELEKSKIKKIVGVYGGRFQPFGPHHKKVYEWLKSKFDDAYITTSNIKQLPRHPMNFAEKVRHMKKMGIPSNKSLIVLYSSLLFAIFSLLYFGCSSIPTVIKFFLFWFLCY